MMRQIEVAWTAKWQRPPTPAEMQELLDQKVREEVLYREALSMGLEQGDTIVKRRLAQKLEFLTEDIAAIRDPTPAELQAWFPKHAAQFASPGRVTFRHVYFSPTSAARKRPRMRERAGEAVAHARIERRVGNRRSFLRTRLLRRSDLRPARRRVRSQFPKELAGLEPGGWRGPIESGLGWHLVWINSVTPGHTPTFAEADRAEVKTAWIDEQRAESKRRTFAAMRAKYEVVMPAAKLP
jgi:hypothetical protein